jgi:hypothetical protein
MGKEEILIEMAKFFKTKIVLNKTRYKNLHNIGLSRDSFTCDPSEGWIFCIKGEDREKYPN